MDISKIPNALCALRILVAGCLLIVPPLSALCLTLYLIGGLSDFLDGKIARRHNVTSVRGARLDSIADAAFFTVSLFVFIPLALLPRWALYWIVGIVLLRLVTLGIGFRRFHTFASHHTHTNRITGGALFVMLPLQGFLGFEQMAPAILVCSLASLASLEEIILMATTKKLDLDTRSLFSHHVESR
jgi:CDP-diacylglycerol--glycerol-3-phosphate 3-phosphatidyltransferase